MVLLNIGGVVGDQVDTRNLLEHLVETCKYRSMEMTIAFFI